VHTSLVQRIKREFDRNRRERLNSGPQAPGSYFPSSWMLAGAVRFSPASAPDPELMRSLSDLGMLSIAKETPVYA
jgi:hypothetical protein